MVAYIDDHRDRFGVEPICKLLPIAPSTYYELKAQERDPDRRSQRAKRDEALKPEIERIYVENFCVYGARKIWKQLNREAIQVARCTTERLTAALGIRGAVRGKAWQTTIPDVDAVRPRDLVQRRFTATAPNQLWVADITYVSTWRNHVVYRLVSPEAVESIDRKFCVPSSVRDVSVPQVVLDSSGVMLVVCQLIACRVPQHVRMNREWDPDGQPSARDHLAHVRVRHGAAALGHEDVGRRRVVPLEPAKSPQLRSPNRVNTRAAFFQPRDMKRASSTVELVPTKCHEF